MRKKWFFIAPAAIAGIILFSFVGGELVKLLWNWLFPSLFGWRQITFWQAFGLLALCRLLFGHHGWRGHGRSHWRDRMRERKARWEAMAPEEREKFRQGMRGHCGFDSEPSKTQS